MATYLSERIFKDIPDNITEDWNHGVIIGGMTSNDRSIARAYKSAGDVLVRQALESYQPWELAEPIFFIYRHAIEIYLKLIVQPAKKNHNLVQLTEELEIICKERHGQKLPVWVKERLQEFVKIDPGSFCFRYAHSLKGNLNIDTEQWIGLEYLHTVMEALCDGFERLLVMEITKS